MDGRVLQASCLRKRRKEKEDKEKHKEQEKAKKNLTRKRLNKEF
jgi:hypothetical protein